jgi:endothelin-converting enzyme
LATNRLEGLTTHTPDTTVAPDLCLEPECIHAASEILYNLDPHYEDIDPCIDFDQYVCGGWRDRHDMRPDQGSIFSGTLMSENAQMRLRHILEASEASEDRELSPADKHNFKKLKSAYHACTDVESLKQRGSQPLDGLLAEIASIYSLHGKDPQKNLTDAILYLMQTDVLALAAFSVSVSDLPGHFLCRYPNLMTHFSLMTVILITWLYS